VRKLLRTSGADIGWGFVAGFFGQSVLAFFGQMEIPPLFRQESGVDFVFVGLWYLLVVSCQVAVAIRLRHYPAFVWPFVAGALFSAYLVVGEFSSTVMPEEFTNLFH
jgi:hypothetical protein